MTHKPTPIQHGISFACGVALSVALGAICVGWMMNEEHKRIFNRGRGL